MQTAFVVQHLPVLPSGEEDVKLIGVHASRRMAERAVNRLATQPGFSNAPRIVDPGKADSDEGFYIDAIQIDQDHWPRGFVAE